METFKIDIWKKDKLNLKYISLNHAKIQEVMNKIAEKYKISTESLNNSSLFVKMSEILKKEIILLDINEPKGFKELIGLLQLNLSQDSLIDIIWNYNSIDQVEYSVLSDYWDYIWYGPSDEMCLLYCHSTQLIIMVTDYGTIYMQ
jgi:hypothetical protein